MAVVGVKNADNHHLFGYDEYIMDLTRIKKALIENPLGTRIDAVYVFGSEALGTATEQSDLDLAILFTPKQLPTFQEQMDLRLLLEDLAGREIDLLVLNTVGPIVAMQAVTKGKLILDNNPSHRVNFVTTLFSRYAELKEMRAPMEKDILKRKYYGGETL